MDLLGARLPLDLMDDVGMAILVNSLSICALRLGRCSQTLVGTIGSVFGTILQSLGIAFGHLVTMRESLSGTVFNFGVGNSFEGFGARFWISVYKDKSFEFVIKTPPAAVQLMEAAKTKKGSGEPNRTKVASVTWDQVRTIAEDKMQNLNAFTIESAMKMVAGTARSMGFTVKGEFHPNS